jgi:hypothetical protein
VFVKVLVLSISISLFVITGHVFPVICILERSVSAGKVTILSAVYFPFSIPSVSYVGPVHVILESLNYFHVILSLASANGNFQGKASIWGSIASVPAVPFCFPVLSVLLSTGTFTKCLQRLLTITVSCAQACYH